jgi:futalosine hydrolase
MKPVLFITATVKEMKAAIGGLGALPRLEQGRVAEHHAKGRECLLLVTGIGVVNAALALGSALAGAEFCGAVVAGVAGTFLPDVYPVGSACFVKTEIWPEYGLKRAGGIDPEGIGFCLGRAAGEDIWDRVGLETDLTKLGLKNPENIDTAVSLTVSGVTGSAEGADVLLKKYDAGIENMEGFAVAYGCALKGLPVCEVRTISNLVGSRSAEDWNLGAAFGKLGSVCSSLF